MKLTAFCTIAFTAFLPLAVAQEQKLTRAQLPKAVATTVDRETKGATIRGYATEREHGKKVYEAETILDGHTRDLQIAEDGTLNEIEEEVGQDALSPNVRKALAAKAKGATINKVESLTKSGKLVAYGAAITRSGKKGEVQVGPAGETLTHAE